MILTKHLYNINLGTAIVDSEQQQLLNDEFDIMITNLFEAFLGQKEFQNLHYHERFEEHQQFFANSKHYIQTFKLLFNRVWPKNLSDFKYKQKLYKVKEEVIKKSENQTIGISTANLM